MKQASEEQSPTDDPATEARPRCRFVVTGFGPFRGVPDNPTSALVRRLRTATGGARGSADEGDDDAAAVVRETHVLETSADHVRGKIDEIYDRLSSRREDADATEEATVVLHLGVNYRGRRFHIERCAYNDATFRVPDERGYQPRGECVIGAGGAESSPELGKRFDTTIDVQRLCDEMQKHNETTISEDPGRFVCNFTYCLSLDKCHSTNMCQNEKGKTYHTLFLHVPPFDVISEDKQLDFVLKIMQTIEHQILGIDNDQSE